MMSLLFAASLAVAQPSACEHSQPIRTTVAAIAEGPDLFEGRCVTIVGFSDGRTLLASSRRLRQYLRMRSALTSYRRFGSEMMGVYGLPDLDDEQFEKQSRDGPEWALTGEVEDCNVIYDRAQREWNDRAHEPDEIPIIMMTGYCHNLPGPTLRVRQARVVEP